MSKAELWWCSSTQVLKLSLKTHIGTRALKLLGGIPSERMYSGPASARRLAGSIAPASWVAQRRRLVVQAHLEVLVASNVRRVTGERGDLRFEHAAGDQRDSGRWCLEEIGMPLALKSDRLVGHGGEETQWVARARCLQARAHYQIVQPPSTTRL